MYFGKSLGHYILCKSKAGSFLGLMSKWNLSLSWTAHKCEFFYHLTLFVVDQKLVQCWQGKLDDIGIDRRHLLHFPENLHDKESVALCVKCEKVILMVI